MTRLFKDNASQKLDCNGIDFIPTNTFAINDANRISADKKSSKKIITRFLSIVSSFS